jgi:predicted nucleic acid-binding protein
VREIFVDSAHYVALLNRRDQLRDRAVHAVLSLYAEPDISFVTTDSVLAEVLTHQSAFGPGAREAASVLIDELSADPRMTIVSQTPALFADGVALYRRRLDKSYSMVDCMSMVLCRERGIRDVLTADRDFEQEGFTILL